MYVIQAAPQLRIFKSRRNQKHCMNEIMLKNHTLVPNVGSM